MKLHTYYDNLKVARNAPPEVIKAAYKAMAQKWHPDKNPNSAEAHRVMRLVNEAYMVLIDPVARVEHDKWIQANEAQIEEESSIRPVVTPKPRPSSPVPPWPASGPAPQPPPKSPRTIWWCTGYFVALAFKYWWLLLVGGWLINTLIEKSQKSNPAVPIESASAPVVPKPYTPIPARQLPTSIPASTKPVYQRPYLAPNGELWPVVAGYLKGYPVKGIGGLSTFTVDNTQNDSDVHAKLFVAGTLPPNEMRQAFIPAHGSFTFRDLIANRYDLRTLDLSTGAKMKSEPFEIKQIETDDGIRYSTTSITLYKVRNGNSQSFSISDAEFGR